MNSTITEILAKIEKEQNVKILFACESGSRAWGFASNDSDYDVRFIYLNEKDWYFSIDESRDVIELPVNEVLDINGWDARKALRLFRKSNAPLFEWLQSPVIYMKDEKFYNNITSLTGDYFLLRAGFHHYYNMAKNCFDNELIAGLVKVKKYFYALRPILACKWIVDKRELPPMEFRLLRQMMDDELQPEVDNLLKLKEQGDEKLYTPVIPSIHKYLINTIKYCEEYGKELPDQTNSTDNLNVLFRNLFQ
jgi:predicted nucleotidyltransferase